MLAALIILLCALSTAYSLRLILRLQHEALYWDQWFTIPLFDRVIRGTATLRDFIAPHGEHRILLPRHDPDAGEIAARTTGNRGESSLETAP